MRADMGVYINMEMPTNCGECPFYWEQRGVNKESVEEGYRTDRERHPDCPLVPVPPHGRLIDADDFIKRINELVRQAHTDGFDLGAAWYTAFIRHIELAPTIIPADKEGNDET